MISNTASPAVAANYRLIVCDGINGSRPGYDDLVVYHSDAELSELAWVIGCSPNWAHYRLIKADGAISWQPAVTPSAVRVLISSIDLHGRQKNRASRRASVGSTPRCGISLDRLAKRFCGKVEIVNLLEVHPEIGT